MQCCEHREPARGDRADADAAIEHGDSANAHERDDYAVRAQLKRQGVLFAQALGHRDGGDEVSCEVQQALLRICELQHAH